MLDTNICIYIINQKPQTVLEKLKKHSAGDLYLSSIVVSELYFGVYNSQRVGQNLSALAEFLKPFSILEYGENEAKQYGKIRADLQKRGESIGSLDMLIAAHALAADMTLITNNTKEFERIRELRCENWV